MKKLLLISVSFLQALLLGRLDSFAQQDWTAQSSGTTLDLRGVSFTDANTGTAVGEAGTILRTTDGAASWPANSDSVNINAEDWAARGGYWNFSGKVIKAKGFIGHNKAYYNRRVFTDFIYEVKLCKIAEDGTFGLLFRYDENNDEGYLLHFWPHGGCRFELIKGGQTRLRSVEVSQPMHQIIGTNVWNTVKIIAHGSKFEIYLNGYLLDTIVDRQYSSGRVGLFVGGDPRQIALFEVTTIKVP